MTYFEQGYNLFMKLALHGDPSTEPSPDIPAPSDGGDGGKPYTREDVQYMDSSPHADKQCSTCAHYQPDGTCGIVMGSINPNGYCDHYS